MAEVPQEPPRQPEQRTRGPVTVVNVLLALNIIVFVLWYVAPVGVMTGHFLVSWQHLAEGYGWVLLTAVFSHNMLLHLAVNMIVLKSFGPPLERVMGAGGFLAFYLIAGLFGSFAHAATSAFLMDSPTLPALGASSALAGVLLLFSLTYPRATVLLFFFIPLPALVAALAFVAIDIWGLIMQVDNGGLPIGHGAHLGGAVIGLTYFLVRGRALKQRTRGDTPRL
jgi:membrane associated rhomboid family serine protease